MVKKYFYCVAFVSIIFLSGCTEIKQDTSQLLQSGPMVGAVEMKEATLWLQTKEPGSVGVEYWSVRGF